MQNLRSCTECGHVCEEDDLLQAPHPFIEGEILRGCPNCRGVAYMARVCDHDGCLNEATCGTPTPAGYRSTCYDHHPDADGTSPAEKTEQTKPPTVRPASDFKGKHRGAFFAFLRKGEYRVGHSDGPDVPNPQTLTKVRKKGGEITEVRLGAEVLNDDRAILLKSYPGCRFFHFDSAKKRGRRASNRQGFAGGHPTDHGHWAHDVMDDFDAYGGFGW